MNQNRKSIPMKNNLTFRDRQDAGRRLAKQLARFKSEDPVVLGLPRGGVVVAFEVAQALDAPLDVIVARKLGAPQNPELGIGAIAPGGVRVLDERLVHSLGIDPVEIEQITAEELIEMDRRLREYRGDRPGLHLQNRTILLIDDGLATGVTARAAVCALRLQNPRKIVLAVPVSAPETAQLLRHDVDELVTLIEPPGFQAVGQFYQQFQQTTDPEVLDLLHRARPPAQGALAGGAI